MSYIRCVFVIFLIGIISAGNSVAKFDSNVTENLSKIKEYCRYALGDRISSAVKGAEKISAADSIVIVFDADFSPKKRNISAKLTFGCNLVPQAVDSNDQYMKRDQPKTAKEEIELEDSGGRYGRNVVWERPYRGANIAGTVAYVNSVSGDRVKIRVPDFLLVCPNQPGLTCFSLEIDKEISLTKAEQEWFVMILGDIRYLSPENRN